MQLSLRTGGSLRRLQAFGIRCRPHWDINYPLFSTLWKSSGGISVAGVIQGGSLRNILGGGWDPCPCVLLRGFPGNFRDPGFPVREVKAGHLIPAPAAVGIIKSIIERNQGDLQPPAQEYLEFFPGTGAGTIPVTNFIPGDNSMAPGGSICNPSHNHNILHPGIHRLMIPGFSGKHR